MRRTIQGLLVTSLLLVGCANSSIQTERKPPSPNAGAIREFAAVHENLTGICKAISRYGLPRDAETRSRIRERLVILGAAIDSSGGSKSAGQLSLERSLRSLADDYARCDPETATEIRSLIP